MKRILPLLFLLPACAALPDRPVANADDQAYVADHPYYAELCSVSEISKKPDFGATIESGGPGGHSVLYLNGVCRDHNAHYPVIGLCDPGHGVGIGSNEHFSNAAWVAVDGRAMLFGPDEPQDLSRNEYSRLRMAAEQTGIYDGIVFHDIAYAGLLPGYSREDWKYEVSIGTDYDIGIARDRYCARVSLSKPQMRQVVDRLNAINQPYREGAKQFVWNVFHANCSHLTHAGLAAACVWDSWPEDQSLLEAATNMPVPKNEFVDLMRRGNDLPVGDPIALYRDESARRDLMENNRLPSEPGVLAYYKPVVKPNEVYNNSLHLIFYDDMVTGSYAPWLDSIMDDKRYTDATVNRRYFAVQYDEAFRAMPPLDQLMPRLGHEEQAQFPAFYQRYRAYITAQHLLYGPFTSQ